MQYNEYRKQVRQFISAARTTYSNINIEKGVQKPFLMGLNCLVCCPIGAAMYPIYRKRGLLQSALLDRPEGVIYKDFSQVYPFTALHVPRTFCEQYIPHVMSHGSYLMRDNETSPLWRLIYLLNDHGGFAEDHYPLEAIEAILYHAYHHLSEGTNE